MASENPIRFTLTNNTRVIVKKVANNKYDFELILPEGNHKTFVWTVGTSEVFKDRKGNEDLLIAEVISKFRATI